MTVFHQIDRRWDQSGEKDGFIFTREYRSVLFAAKRQ